MDPGRVVERLRPVLPQLTVLLVLPACFLFGLVNRSVLPDKFFFDDAHIQADMPSATGVSARDSFITMAWLYRGVGALDHPAEVQAITMVVFFALLFVCAPWSRIATFGVPETAVFCFAAAACAVYLAQYSKESIVLLLVLVLMSTRRLPGELLFIGLVCLYAGYIRSYWFMVVAVYFLVRLALTHGRRAWPVVLLVVASVLVFAIGADVAFGVELNSFRTAVAETRVNSLNAQSAIQDYLTVSDPGTGTLNALITLLLLMVPIPLLIDPSAIYLLFSVVIGALWVTLAVTVASGVRAGWFRRDPILARATALLIAMVTVQAVFEPDYGSYLKHLTPLLPLFVVVLMRYRDRRRQALSGPDAAPAARTAAAVR